MKNIIPNTLFCLGALLVVFPWIIGIVDMAWYIMFGTQVSNMAWGNSNRAFLALSGHSCGC